jgi:hypothetical protein
MLLFTCTACIKTHPFYKVPQVQDGGCGLVPQLLTSTGVAPHNAAIDFESGAKFVGNRG